jgi:hypothetical protein
MADFTEQDIIALMDEYRTTPATNKELAIKYDKSEVTIQKYTTGLKKDLGSVDPDVDIEKAEKNNRLQALQALKDVGINAKSYAIGVKSLLDSGDPQYIRDGLKMLSDTMGLSAKADKAANAQGSNITEKMYVLKMPKRD